MYQIKVENCNNIKEGIINIAPNKLNMELMVQGRLHWQKQFNLQIIVMNY